MTNRVQNKRSSTENNRPDPGALLAGEIAINTNAASANVHFEDASSNVRNVGADPLATAENALYVRQVDTDGVGTWVAAPPGDITQEEADLRYLRVDVDATDQTRVSGEATFSDGIRSTYVNSIDNSNRFNLNDATGTSGFTLTTRGLTAGSTGVRGILANINLDSAVSSDISIVQANIAGTTTTDSDINGFTFTRASGVSLNTTGDVKAFSCGIADNVNAGGNAYCLYSDGTAPSYHVGDFRIGSGDLNNNPTQNLGQDNTKIGSKIYNTGGGTFNSNASTTLSIANNGSGSSKRLINFWVGGQSGVCGKMYANNASTMTIDVGNGGNFVNTSDYRVKTNIDEFDSSVDTVKALKPVFFNYKEDLTTTHAGFIAHQVQEVVPNAVVGEKDAVDDAGLPQYQGVDQTKLIPYLTKALQEALGRIEALEAAAGGGTATTRKRKS